MSWSSEEWVKWLAYMKEQVDDLASMALAAYPEGTKEHVRARCLLIRLRMFLERLRLALSTAS